MFNGEYEHSLDDKGRVIVPKSFREDFAEGLYVTRGIEGCVWIFTMPVWRDISEALSTSRLTSTQARRLDRILYTGMEQGLDKQGRVLIPQYLREHGGFQPSEHVTVLGVKNRLEVWNKDRWREHSAKLINDLGEELDSGLAQVGI